ncbi:siphovirus ReqiPepy6 Gp37-like family protein [Methanoculleus sp. UBA312]|uniref:siphovirus ReqiPepy6 Gp37-like family protein n=1 Tax=Methanoculleus sp. UBA312 TaxID=1915499 RepID=UPI0031BBB578
MPTDISIQQAGTWPLYRLTLSRGTDPLPLAGVMATLYAIHARYSGWQIRQPMTVEDAAAGQLLCAFGPEDTVHPGTYNVQVRLLWGDGTSTTLPAAGYFQMEIGPALEPEDTPPEPLRVYERSGSTLVLKAVIDAYEAIEWTRRWRAPGSWQAVISRYATGADELREGRFISLPRRGRHLVGIIESIEGQMTDEGEISESWTVAGRDLGAILQDRICLHGVSAGTGYDEQIDVVGETAMRHYVDVNAVSPTDPDRAIPGLDLMLVDQGRGATVQVRARFQSLPEILESIALQSGLGWDVIYSFDTDEILFDALEGADRSAEILLSPRLGNCLIAGYRACLSDAPTLAIVAGQGEADLRTITEVGTATGWSRREVYIDARDLATTDELTARGQELLADRGETTTLEVEYLPTPTYRYMTDFDLGDIVSAEYPGVATMQARIVAVTEQYPSGRIVLGLGKEWPDLISLLRTVKRDNAETRR